MPKMIRKVFESYVLELSMGNLKELETVDITLPSLRINVINRPSPAPPAPVPVDPPAT
jgi:hypothetical protein